MPLFSLQVVPVSAKGIAAALEGPVHGPGEMLTQVGHIMYEPVHKPRIESVIGSTGTVEILLHKLVVQVFSLIKLPACT